MTPSTFTNSGLVSCPSMPVSTQYVVVCAYIELSAADLSKKFLANVLNPSLLKGVCCVWAHRPSLQSCESARVIVNTYHVSWFVSQLLLMDFGILLRYICLSLVTHMVMCRQQFVIRLCSV